MLRCKKLFEKFCQSQIVLGLCLFFFIVNLDCTDLPQLPAKGVCAHRGANSSHPENTLSAFREAIRLGAHMIEFDVQFSKDGAVVIIHDAAVDRTTDGHGLVADLTLAEIKSLDVGLWKGVEYTHI
ncbi:MAG: glycerophosphodiester phosphodiesterase, partial [bacterium]